MFQSCHDQTSLLSIGQQLLQPASCSWSTIHCRSQLVNTNSWCYPHHSHLGGDVILDVLLIPNIVALILLNAAADVAGAVFFVGALATLMLVLVTPTDLGQLTRVAQL